MESNQFMSGNLFPSIDMSVTQHDTGLPKRHANVAVVEYAHHMKGTMMEDQVALVTSAQTAAQYMSEGGIALRQAADLQPDGDVREVLVTLADAADEAGQEHSGECEAASTQDEMWQAADALVQGVVDLAGPLSDELLDLIPEAGLEVRGLLSYAYTYYRGALGQAHAYLQERSSLSEAEASVLSWLDENTEWVTA